jgi:DNA transformation protein
MPVDQALLSRVLRTCGPLGEGASRKMGSGAGLYAGEALFGFIQGEALYLRANEQTVREHKHAGMKQLPAGNARAEFRNLWQVPPDVIASPERLRTWIERAVRSSKDG